MRKISHGHENGAVAGVKTTVSLYFQSKYVVKQEDSGRKSELPGLSAPFRPPGTPKTESQMRRNGDAVAPERRCRRAGTVMPSRRNGDAVAPERQPVSPMETQSLNSEGGVKAALTFRPRLRAPRSRTKPRSGLLKRPSARVRERNLRSFQTKRWLSLLPPLGVSTTLSTFPTRLNVTVLHHEGSGRPILRSQSLSAPDAESCSCSPRPNGRPEGR